MSGNYDLSSAGAVSAAAGLARDRANQEPAQGSYNAAYLHGYADALADVAGQLEPVKGKTIKVLVVEPGKPCQVREVEDELKAFQAIVDGYIETVTPFAEPITVVCNEEGKLRGLPYNRPLLDQHGTPYDILCGTFFVAGVDGDRFVSLTDEQAGRFKSMYDNMMILPTKPQEKRSEKRKGGPRHER